MNIINQIEKEEMDLLFEKKALAKATHDRTERIKKAKGDAQKAGIEYVGDEDFAPNAEEIEAAKVAVKTVLFPDFNVGDNVKVFVKVIEGNRERLQAFEGTVIAKRNGGLRETFTVRRLSFGIGVERTFPLYSPKLDHIEITRQGKVRRAKLYYLRGRLGKAAKVRESTR